jgi:hypothetical protein
MSVFSTTNEGAKSDMATKDGNCVKRETGPENLRVESALTLVGEVHELLKDSPIKFPAALR